MSGCTRLCRGIFHKFTTSVVSKMAIACASKDFVMTFFSTKRIKLLPRGSGLLSGWEDVSALSKKVLTQLNALSTFAMEALLELVRFVQCPFLDG